MTSKNAVLAIGLGCVLLTTGCHKLFGGGWFYGEEFVGAGKVTFGFQAQCINDPADPDFPWAFYEGQFQYSDPSNRVRFHGDIDPLVWVGEVADCEEAAAILVEFFGSALGGGHFSGPCWTQPGKVEGYFEVGVTDNGTPGPSAGDSIDVSTNCTPDGEEYHNEGQLGGGNIWAVGH